MNKKFTKFDREICHIFCREILCDVKGVKCGCPRERRMAVNLVRKYWKIAFNQSFNTLYGIKHKEILPR
jgi:hypothetical protein